MKFCLELLDKIIAWVKSHDSFGTGPHPFNMEGRPKANSWLGGSVSMFIKFITATFFMFKVIEMS